VVVLVLVAGEVAIDAGPDHLQELVLGEFRVTGVVQGLGEGPGQADWDSRGHFFAAAAEAMRRILVDSARRKHAAKRGGGAGRVPLEEFHRVAESPGDLLDLDDALTRFAAEEPDKARLVQLRFFAGLSTPDAAAALGISVATAERWWTYARAWLYSDLQRGEKKSSGP
jgi:RNA polymerase sigma factor (TIGR02999 family)